MTEPLRPLSVGELLDRTFSLYRQNFKLLVGVAILGPLALLCFQMALAFVGVGGQNARGVVQNPASVGVTVLLGTIFYLTGHAVSVAATTRAVAAVYLGKAITVAEAFASVRGRVLRVIGVMFAAMVIAGLVGMALVGAGAAIFAAALAGGKSAGGPVGVAVGGVIGAIALVASIVTAIAFGMRYALSVQACIVEDLAVKASLVRSKLLTKDARKRILTVLFVCTMVIYAVTLLFAGLSRLVPVGGNLLARQVVSNIFGLFAGVIGAPLATAALSLVYYDERVRKEAFDLQLLMDSLEAPATARTAEASPSLG